MKGKKIRLRILVMVCLDLGIGSMSILTRFAFNSLCILVFYKL